MGAFAVEVFDAQITDPHDAHHKSDKLARIQTAERLEKLLDICTHLVLEFVGILLLLGIKLRAPHLELMSNAWSVIVWEFNPQILDCINFRCQGMPTVSIFPPSLTSKGC